MKNCILEIIKILADVRRFWLARLDTQGIKFMKKFRVRPTSTFVVSIV